MTSLDNVAERIGKNLETLKSSGTEIVGAVPLSKAWIESETANSTDNPARQLLTGSRLALLESATTWGLGLNRGAAGSLRTYVENIFAWQYYRDHPVEYSLVEKRKDGILLPKAVQKYLKEIDSGFEKSYGMLTRKMKRSNEYYYTDLSFYVHAHPTQLLNQKSASEATVTIPPDEGFLEVCSSIDEFISDNLVVRYRHSWGLVPEEIKANLAERLGDDVSDFLAIV